MVNNSKDNLTVFAITKKIAEFVQKAWASLCYDLQRRYRLIVKRKISGETLYSYDMQTENWLENPWTKYL
jgi:hypothetical protein